MSVNNENKPTIKEGSVSGWIEERLPIFSYISEHLGQYRTPKNLSYFWNFWFISWYCFNDSDYYRYLFSNALYASRRSCF